MLPPQLIRDGLGVAASAFWVKGANSSGDPAFLEDTQYRSAMNVVNRGGLLKTRPGYNCLAELPEGRPQGYHFFTPTGGPPTHVFAIGGKIYALSYPFTQLKQVPGIQFFEGSELVVFEEAEQSVEQNPDGSLSLIDPRKVLMMQDGRTPAAFWDGDSGRHLDPAQQETPLGLWMKWSGDRLWLMRGPLVLAGDIGNPLKFSETEYLAEGGGFRLPEEGTGFAEVPVVENSPPLIAFTRSGATMFRSGVRDRALWKETENFQTTLFDQIGCVSGNTIVTQYNRLWWMSAAGVTDFNSAIAAQQNSAMAYRDMPMSASKGNMSPNIDTACACAFENYLLFSVPSGDLRNRHTWVLDQTVTEDGAVASWNGVWTGTRPVQWGVGTVNGIARCFHLSKDYDGRNRLWEAFIPSRQDNGQPVTCYVETKSHANFRDDAQGLDMKTFRFAELEFVDISGILDVKVYWAGLRGNYRQLTTFRFVAPGVKFGQQTFTLDSTTLFSSRPQSRTVRTTEVVDDATLEPQCGVESEIPARHDRAFSLLIVWSGRAALRSYRVFARRYDESGVGAREGQVENADDAVTLRRGRIDSLNDCRG